MIYPKEKVATWEPLDEHLRNPMKFPKGITSHFLVAFLPPAGWEDSYPWRTGEMVIFLSEIPGMRGHGIFAGEDGLVRYGYHTDNFYVIPAEEM